MTPETAEAVADEQAAAEVDAEPTAEELMTAEPVHEEGEPQQITLPSPLVITYPPDQVRLKITKLADGAIIDAWDVARNTVHRIPVHTETAEWLAGELGGGGKASGLVKATMADMPKRAPSLRTKKGRR